MHSQDDAYSIHAIYQYGSVLFRTQPALSGLESGSESVCWVSMQRHLLRSIGTVCVIQRPPDRRERPWFGRTPSEAASLSIKNWEETRADVPQKRLEM